MAIVTQHLKNWIEQVQKDPAIDDCAFRVAYVIASEAGSVGLNTLFERGYLAQYGNRLVVSQKEVNRKSQKIETFIRLDDVLRITGLNVSAVNSLVKTHKLPQPVKIARRIRVWIESEIVFWMQARVNQRNTKS